MRIILIISILCSILCVGMVLRQNARIYDLEKKVDEESKLFMSFVMPDRTVRDCYEKMQKENAQ